MNKKLLFLLLTVTCTTFTMNAQNLLANANPGFEGLAATPGTTPYDWWGFYNEGPSAATITDQTAIVHGGTHAAKVVVGTAAANYQPQLTNGNTINLTEGHSYTVTFWIRALSAGSTIAGSSNVYNVNGGKPFGDSFAVSAIQWQQYTHTFTADADTPTYQLWINLGGSVNTYYIDDASLVDNTALGIEDFSKNDKISFYPNPVNDNLNISSDATIKSITISDVVGKTVRTIKNAENIQSINLSDLKQGMYILSTDTNKQFKFLKN